VDVLLMQVSGRSNKGRGEDPDSPLF